MSALRRAVRRLLVRASPPPLTVSAPRSLLDVLRDGATPLTDEGPSRAQADRLRLGLVIPSFRRGSGGHATIATLVRGLERRGHACSLWLEDHEGRHATETETTTARLFAEFFGPVAGPLHAGFKEWTGADVIVATGWQTVPSVLRLPGAAARAYLVQDHEPEFYGTSAEHEWATWSYGQGLHAIAASAWLAQVIHDRYGAPVSAFDLGVDHSIYRPLGVPRRDDLILLYARAVTARRAVPLGVLALAELHLRRPGLELALFGEARPIATPFPHRMLGVVDPARLAATYGEATVGVVLSMTNPSLVPTEMLACGLPVVDLASDSMISSFGRNGPLELAPFDPMGVADAVERLLDDPQLRATRSAHGIALAAERRWDRAAEQVETGLRAALAAGEVSGRA